MTKVTKSRLLETSRYIATQAGQQLQDFITYVADLAENTVRALQKGIGLDDNLDVKRLTLTVKHNVETVVNTDGRKPIWIAVAQVLSSSVGVDHLTWFQNTAGDYVVKIGLTTAPTGSFDVSLVMFFS